MFVNDWKINPTLASVALIQFPKRIKRYLKHYETIEPEHIKDIFRAYKDGQLAKDGILLSMRDVAAYGRWRVPPVCSGKELNDVIAESQREITSMKLLKPEKKLEVLMGIVMEKVRGRIDGSVVAKTIGLLSKEAK
jgi:glutamyl-tRNA(Gln) amidotransferase subunit E